MFLAHCLIRRDGEIVQYVPLISVRGMRACQTIRGGNVVMISIGIELEGTDTLAYTDAQYQQLAAVTRTLIACYPAIADNMTDTRNIAPDRKRTLASF